ncbi:MAG: hypothetical protein H0W61_14390 [Bacteroidetes bacterium]|nr:hypothetical protein [Bacteroidota bacterium]
MKTTILSLSLVLLLLQVSCGPAAESRESMQSRAKHVADSIANSIKASMAEAETPGPAINTVKIDTAAAKTPSAPAK